jgi:hypothetical protein
MQPALGATAVLVIFLIFFRDPQKSKAPQPEGVSFPAETR